MSNLEQRVAMLEGQMVVLEEEIYDPEVIDRTQGIVEGGGLAALEHPTLGKKIFMGVFLRQWTKTNPGDEWTLVPAHQSDSNEVDFPSGEAKTRLFPTWDYLRAVDFEGL